MTLAAGANSRAELTDTMTGRDVLCRFGYNRCDDHDFSFPMR